VDDAASGGNDISLYKTTREQLVAQLAWQTGVLGQLTGAVEHGEDKASTTSYQADVVRRNTAFVLALDGSAAAWSWQADARHDDSSDFGSVDTGRLGGSYAFAPGLRVRALAGTTFRAPSFNDLYFPGYGVPTLVPERGRSMELGLNWTSGASDASATVYRNKVRELIAYEGDRSFCPPDPAYDFGCAANVKRASLEGATFSAGHRMGALGLKAQADFLEARDDATGQRLQRRAAHQGSVGADWNAGVWNVGGNVLRLGSRPDGGKQLAAETTLDLTAGWKFMPKWSLQAKLLNATDVDTEPARDYQGLGRQAWLALRFEGNL
jgi:vitamin B12 transporter